MATAIKPAPVKVEQTVIATDTVVTNPVSNPNRTSLFKRVEGVETIPYVLHHVEFMSARNEEDKDNPMKGSAFLYSVNNPLVPIGLIPTSALVRMCVSSGVKADQAHASLQYVVGSQAGIQFAPVGTVLSNGVVVDEDHEDYYITFCKVIFGTPFKNAVANIAGGVAMDTSSKYDDVDIFGIQ
jgi:hypothetical protein